MLTIVGEGSPVALQTPVIYQAIEIRKYGTFKQRVPGEFNALIYLLQGSIGLSNTAIAPFEGAVLKRGSEIEVTANQHSKFIFLAGKPHNEPIMLRGSFVD
jgi:redox-sensitive bicupin YhaK (pirin superfamily)